MFLGRPPNKACALNGIRKRGLTLRAGQDILTIDNLACRASFSQNLHTERKTTPLKQASAWYVLSMISMSQELPTQANHGHRENYLHAQRKKAGLSQREVGILLGYADEGAVSRHESET